MLIAAIASCGGSSTASGGFHDAKTLSASVLTQVVAYENQGLAHPQCVTPGHQIKDPDTSDGVLSPNPGMVACRDGVAVVECPETIETVVVCRDYEKNPPVNLRVTVAKDGLTYTATGPTGVTLTDSTGG